MGKYRNSRFKKNLIIYIFYIILTISSMKKLSFLKTISLIMELKYIQNWMLLIMSKMEV